MYHDTRNYQPQNHQHEHEVGKQGICIKSRNLPNLKRINGDFDWDHKNCQFCLHSDCGIAIICIQQNRQSLDHDYHEDQQPCQKSWGVDTELRDDLLHLVSVHYQQLTIDRSQFKLSTLTIDRSQYQLSTKWVLSGLIIGNHHNYFYLGLKVENETQSVCWCCVQEVGVERGLVVNRKVFSLS